LCFSEICASNLKRLATGGLQLATGVWLKSGLLATRNWQLACYVHKLNWFFKILNYTS
jgi:hypothetical protein